MALANAYATVIAEAEEKGLGAEFVKKLVAFMKSRGHLSLLPQVVRILKRKPASSNIPVVILAKESDAKKFAKPIRETLSTMNDLRGHSLKVDPRAVGGYSVRAGGRLVDKTFRTALISLYQSATR